jgi:hypothetical protein
MKKVFIGGCDRSGTTLLGSLIGKVEGAVVTPESQFKTEFVENFGLLNELNISHVTWLIHHWRFVLWDFEASELDEIKEKALGQRLEVFCEIAVIIYARKNNIKKVSLWVDHTPDNMRKCQIIKKLFGEDYISFIHIVRDPRAVFSSVKNLDWGPNTAFFGAKWYAVNITNSIVNEMSYNIFRVRFEELIVHNEQILLEVCKEISICYILSERTISSFTVPSYTKKQHSKIKSNSFQKSSISSWRKKLTFSEINEIERQLGDTIVSLGYNLENINHKASTPNKFYTCLAEFSLGFINRFKRFVRSKL